ncbi:MAG: hypothetical protein V4553_10035 [Bacteroidota bacterium]
MKICVLSGRYPASDYLSAENHRIYCSYHGYYYIHCNWPTPAKNPYLNKFYFLRHYIDLFDYIFWIDDDAFFLDLNKPLAEFIPSNGHVLSICKSPSNKIIKTFFSSGSFMIDCKQSKEFVNAVLDTDLAMVKNWWKPEYGFFTNGDQDIMVFLYLTKHEYQDRFEFFDYMAFNSRPTDVQSGLAVFLVHFTGSSKTKKIAYKKIQSILNVDGSLISDNFKNDYKVIDTHTLYYILKNLYYRVKRTLHIK